MTPRRDIPIWNWQLRDNGRKLTVVDLGGQTAGRLSVQGIYRATYDGSAIGRERQ